VGRAKFQAAIGGVQERCLLDGVRLQANNKGKAITYNTSL
jgi:hypothetical protein